MKNWVCGLFLYTQNRPNEIQKIDKRAPLLTKVVESANKEEIKKIIEKVISVIRAKFPLSARKTLIYIQQDNAKPHLSVKDPDLKTEALKDGWHLKLKCQSRNVLDLRFLQNQMAIKGMNELIDAH